MDEISFLSYYFIYTDRSRFDVAVYFFLLRINTFLFDLLLLSKFYFIFDLLSSLPRYKQRITTRDTFRELHEFTGDKFDTLLSEYQSRQHNDKSLFSVCLMTLFAGSKWIIRKKTFFFFMITGKVYKINSGNKKEFLIWMILDYTDIFSNFRFLIKPHLTFWLFYGINLNRIVTDKDTRKY